LIFVQRTGRGGALETGYEGCCYGRKFLIHAGRLPWRRSLPVSGFRLDSDSARLLVPGSDPSPGVVACFGSCPIHPATSNLEHTSAGGVGRMASLQPSSENDRGWGSCQTLLVHPGTGFACRCLVQSKQKEARSKYRDWQPSIAPDCCEMTLELISM
jgi:hypothetical protein